MITIRKPTKPAILEQLESLRTAPFSYDALGCTSRDTPSGYVRDEAQFDIGSGEAAWIRACDAIQTWKMFPPELATTVRWPSDSLEPGTLIAVVCKAAGLWTVNPSRILAVHDSVSRGRRRFGFTYGTLPGHVARGEESFCVEWDEETDVVRYRIVAVSRPQHALCWLGYPYTRIVQAKFRRLSGKSMTAAVTNSLQTALPSKSSAVLARV